MMNCYDLQPNLGDSQLNGEPVRSPLGNELALNHLFGFILVTRLTEKT